MNEGGGGVDVKQKGIFVWSKRGVGEIRGVGGGGVGEMLLIVPLEPKRALKIVIERVECASFIL